MKLKSVLFGLFILFGLIALNLSSFSVDPVLSGNQYIEERCVDVSSYLASGYITDYIDDNGCEVVKKNIACGSTILSAREDCACRPDCTGPTQCSGSFPLRVGCNGYKAVCSSVCTDRQGGTERVVNTCDFDTNDLLAAESFTGGKSISKFDTRYPIKSFCRAHPALFTDNSLKQTTTSTTVYDTLINGGTVNIETDQTLTIFYIIENNQNLPTVCDSTNNLALNTETGNTCVSTLGFTYLCSEGQFDALTGTCVVQALSETICEKGRYDINSEMCIYNPPIQVDCQKDTCFYSIDKDTCVCAVEQEFICPDGFDFYEPLTKTECNNKNGVWSECPQCPAGEICPERICTPRCSIGQVCQYDAPSITICKDNDAIFDVNSNICEKDGETITLCPDTFIYNEDTELCERVADSRLVCEDNSQPKLNLITGNLECLVNPPIYINCPENTVYEQNTKQCLPEIISYDPETNDFVIYKEVSSMCESDSQCDGILKDSSCDKDSGVCYLASKESLLDKILNWFKGVYEFIKGWF